MITLLRKAVKDFFRSLYKQIKRKTYGKDEAAWQRLIYRLYPRAYWERRHKVGGLGSVGRIGESDEYNLELYSRKKRTLNAVLDGLDLQGGKVLDVGCGIGLMQELYVKKGFDVIGIDFSARAIKKARELYPTFQFRQQVIEQVEESGFDVINCLELTMHIVSDRKWENTLNRFKDKTKPGGYVIVSDKMSIEGYGRDSYHIKNRGLKEYFKVLHGMEFVSLTPYPSHPYSIAVFRKRS